MWSDGEAAGAEDDEESQVNRRDNEDRDYRAWKLGVIERMQGFNLIKTIRAIHRSTLHKHAKSTLLAIVDFWSRKRPVPFPSVAKLSACTGLCEKSTKRAIVALEKAGILVVFRRSNRSHRYDLSAVRAWCEAHQHPLFADSSPEDVSKASGEASAKPLSHDEKGLKTEGGGYASPPRGVRQSDGEASGGYESPPKEPRSLKEPKRQPHSSGKPDNGSSSSPSKKERAPQDNATLLLEDLYCDFYEKASRRSYYSGTRAAQSKQRARARKAFKSLHEALGVEDAKLAITAAFEREWTAANRSAPWEILADAKKLLLPDYDAGDAEFRLRPSTDHELALQSRISGKDREIIEKSRAGEYNLNPAWAFERGFNPENSGWLQSAHAQNQWAAVQAARGNITPRYRAMVVNFSKKEICHMLFMASIRPSTPGYASFSLWCTKDARAEVEQWIRDWDAERKSA